MSLYPPFTEEVMRHECHQCGRSYKWRSSLKSHLQNECGKEPRFVCPHCPYRCKVRSNLFKHLRNYHKTYIAPLKKEWRRQQSPDMLSMIPPQPQPYNLCKVEKIESSPLISAYNTGQGNHTSPSHTPSGGNYANSIHTTSSGNFANSGGSYTGASGCGGYPMHSPSHGYGGPISPPVSIPGSPSATKNSSTSPPSYQSSPGYQSSPSLEVREEIQKIKLVQQDKLIATPPSSQQITLTPTSSLIATPPQTATPTSPVKLSGTPLQLLSNNNLVQGSQLQSLLTGGTQQLKLLNPLQLQGAGQTQKIYLTNISRLITINPQKPGAPGVPTLLLDRGPASTITVNQNTTNTTPGNPPTTNEVLSCNMCGKKYQWKQSLTRHIREHRCAKGPQHSCPCCNLSFKHTSSLNKHVMLCTAVHSRLMQAQGDGLPIGDDEVMEVKEDEEMDEEDGESCDNNDAIVDDLEEEEEEEDELDPLNTT
ncbi:hypothetical protein M8J76_015924 [Diaphorina citri]|nr:hypothetical protein M8J75_013403 [Diaphorina citri]KAI5719852.1 hypothetical protein M8J76_015924 [Diaphorina citri]